MMIGTATIKADASFQPQIKATVNAPSKVTVAESTWPARIPAA